jgi:adenylylsulfate kinase
MQKDTKLRTILKTVSWRITATTTTVVIVYIFTGQIQTAIEVGLMEMLAKMIIYYLHERGWDNLKFGREEVPSFVLWITGLPISGKTTLGDMIADELAKQKRKYERLDSHTVRALFPETGFTEEDVNRHIKRVGHLASILENNGIIAIASFVSPFRESKEFVRQICRNFVEVHLETTPEFAEQFDENGFYDKARKQHWEHVPGISSEYEHSQKAELTFDMQKISLEKVKKEVIKYINSHYS